jgi:hypothetical protein
VSLAVAVPFGVAAAVAFGTATAVQHSAVQDAARSAQDRSLARLLRSRRWLLSIAGDGLGVLLQVVALAAGPVVVVQPLFVLAVPVSLPVRSLLGGPRPRPSDLLACLAIIGGLTAFLLLAGPPGRVRLPTAAAVVVTVAVSLAAGGVLCAGVRRAGPRMRAGGYGGVAGAWFGVAGVLVNTASTAASRHSVGWLVGHSMGQASLVGMVALAVLGMALTQLAFQLAPLAASFPANEAAGPFAAVLLGAAILHEHVGADAGRIAVYALCLVVIVLGTVRLAGGETLEPTHPPDAKVRSEQSDPGQAARRGRGDVRRRGPPV